MSALTITARDAGSRARAGVLRTAHGEIRTPHFVPLATKATVKGLLPAEVAALGYDIVLGNTYHLFLDPGHELIAGGRSPSASRSSIATGPRLCSSGAGSRACASLRRGWPG